jgi:curved DNA-binding protein CbpA
MRPASTLYDILGVESHATEKEIRVAFRKMAQKQHPDRFSGFKRQQAETQFQLVTEAFNVLSHPEARERYDKEISQPAGNAPTMDRHEIARRLAANGAQTFRDGDPAGALDSLRSAIDHDDECSRAHYFLGIILARLGGRDREAMRHIEKAALLEPNNATINGEAAALFFGAGMKSRAERFVSKALEMDPDNARANEVLREMEQDDKPDNEGFLSRLRRKG